MVITMNTRSSWRMRQVDNFQCHIDLTLKCTVTLAPRSPVSNVEDL